MNLKLRVTFIVASLLVVFACSSHDSVEFQPSDYSMSDIASIVQDAAWSATAKSYATVTIRERLFGIWKSTSLSVPIAGFVSVTDEKASGEVTVNLGSLTSDDKRRDEYLRTKLFTNPSQSIMLCSVVDFNLESEKLNLPQTVESRCSIGNFSAEQSWLITEVVGGAQPKILLQSRVLLDSYGIMDISQEPIVKVARVVSVEVELNLLQKSALGDSP